MSQPFDATKPTGPTRFATAVKLITQFVNTPTSDSKPRRFGFYTFTNAASGSRPFIQPYFTPSESPTAAEIIRVMKTLAPTGNTPLAGALCAAIDELISSNDLIQPAGDNKRYIKIYTDGEENSTPSPSSPGGADQCYGRLGAGLKPWDDNGNPNASPPILPTWQSRVWNKLFTGNPKLVPPPALITLKEARAVFNATFVAGDSFSPATVRTVRAQLPPTMSLLPEAAEQPNGESTFRLLVPEEQTRASELTGVRSALSSALPVSPERAFFAEWARVTKGVIRTYTSVAALPILGDANGNGCVDIADYRLVVANLGKKPPANALYDFDENGIINSADQLAVTQNLGKGCK